MIYQYPCDAWYTHARVEPCLLGAQNASKTLVVWGDSIVLQWFSLLPALFPQPTWRIIILTKSACALVDADYYYARIGRNYEVCTTWRNAVLDELVRIQPDVLIMGNAATYKLTEMQWREGSVRILQQASAVADKVLVMAGTPSLGFDGPGCLVRQSRLHRLVTDNLVTCIAEKALARIEPVNQWLYQATQGFANVHWLDLNDLVCPANQCRAMNEQGIAVFRDSQHLTDSFVRSVIPAVQPRAMTLLATAKPN